MVCRIFDVDPIYMGTDNKERKYAKHYDDQLSFLNTFWKDIEFNVIDNADIVIFTNKNQKNICYQKILY